MIHRLLSGARTRRLILWLMTLSLGIVVAIAALAKLGEPAALKIWPRSETAVRLATRITIIALVIFSAAAWGVFAALATKATRRNKTATHNQPPV
jgi:hypothetical protein